MNYHLYFHGKCLDGVLTAALFYHFLEGRGEGVASLNPCFYRSNFPVFWQNYKFKEPFGLFDFRYHPRADWWIDHHLSTFAKADWEKNFKNDSQHHFGPQHPSCFGLTLNFLKEQYHYQPSALLAGLEQEVDKIDSAGYTSATEAIDLNSQTKELQLLLSYYEKIDPDGVGELHGEIIEGVVKGDIQGRVEKKYRSAIDQLKDKQQQGLRWYQEATEVRGRVIFINKIGQDIIGSDFEMHFLFPQFLYSVFISEDKNSYHLGAGRNPWYDHQSVSDLSLGELFKGYGGGGHHNVGAVEVSSEKKALKTIEEIIQYLNKNG